MKRSFVHLCVVAFLLLPFGCIDGPSPLPTASSPKSALPPSPAEFYTVHWAIENGWAPGLERIDTSTGLGTSLCVFDIDPDPEFPSTFFTPYGVAFDTDGTMYTIVSWFDGIQEHSKARFARVDMQTCTLTYIGDPYSINMAGPEIDACGNVYATGFTVGPPETGGEPTYVWGDSYLYHIDKTTGVATQIGDTGHTEWMDLAFDSKGRLWATFANDLYLLDTETGASTFVTHVSGVPQDNVPGVCPEDWPWMEIMSIAFDENDVLWATAMKGFSWCDDNDAPLMSVDIDTGVATVVGYTHQGYNHGGDIMPSKVRVCHQAGKSGRFVSLEIGIESLQDHLDHGDYVGCDCSTPNGGGNENLD